MSKHTAGPWRARRISELDENRWGNVTGADKRIVCTFMPALYTHRRDAEIGANARLIAAAPDLLAALETIANMVSAPHFTPDRRERIGAIAREAVAQASGI